MNIIQYDQDEHFEVWDDFVINRSSNGTLYHTRHFLSYHPPERFNDTSILIYDGDKNKDKNEDKNRDKNEDNNGDKNRGRGDLVCVFPCCKIDDKYVSHQGSTYGGPVIVRGADTEMMHKIVECIFEHYGVQMRMRVANDIYMSDSQSTLIYLLSRKLKLGLELGFYIDGQETGIDESQIKNRDNLRLFRKFKTDGSYQLSVANGVEEYRDFYRMLESNLMVKHGTKPTHTLGEFLSLRGIFGENQVLCLCRHNGSLISGMFFVEVRPGRYYTVYIAQNYDIQVHRAGSLLGIVDYLMRNRTFDILDFGICTEDYGNMLNLGLAGFKECSLGGSATYRYIFS